MSALSADPGPIWGPPSVRDCSAGGASGPWASRSSTLRATRSGHLQPQRAIEENRHSHAVLSLSLGWAGPRFERTTLADVLWWRSLRQSVSLREPGDADGPAGATRGARGSALAVGSSHVGGPPACHRRRPASFQTRQFSRTSASSWLRTKVVYASRGVLTIGSPRRLNEVLRSTGTPVTSPKREMSA